MKLESLTALAALAGQVAAVGASGSEQHTDRLFFYEKFDEDVLSTGKWVRSKSSKYTEQKVLIQPSHTAAPGFEEDSGLRLTEEMRHYGVGAMFPKPFEFAEGKDFVVQYDVKLEEGLSCGGAYIKLIRENEGGEKFSMEGLENTSPYTVMFGPDHCGAANDRVHFILQNRNAQSGAFAEKHFNDTPPVLLDKKTHLYTLVVRAADSVPKDASGVAKGSKVEMYQDMKLVREGHLLTHMNPPVNPPTMIDDPHDEKPADWVDEAYIPDPDQKKPDDWDEDAPRRIPDPTKLEKPPQWDEDAPEMIPNPEASKPADWDDEEDGEWEAPMVRNPSCDTPRGCGKWVVPIIANPDYKGPWVAPNIPNPDYKGPWHPRKIPNPDQSHDENPLAHLAPIVGVAVEVWTTVGSIHLDNVVVATNLVDAFKFAEETFVAKSVAENAAEKAQAQAAKAKHREDVMARGTWQQKLDIYVSEIADLFLDSSPLQMAMIVGATLTFIAISTFYLLGIGKAPAVAKTGTAPDVDTDGDDADAGAAGPAAAAAEKTAADKKDE